MKYKNESYTRSKAIAIDGKEIILKPREEIEIKDKKTKKVKKWQTQK